MANNQDYSILARVVLDLNDIQQQLNQAARNAKIDFGGTQAQSAQKSMDELADSVQEVGLTYQQANAIFRKTIEVMSAMVDQVYELDSAITEFKKVSDLQGSSLDKYVDKLSQAGISVGRTASEMVEAASMFRKSGFNDSDAAQLAEVASMFQNVADTEISASEAAASITSQLRAFGEGADYATHVIDAYNQVANNFSVGTNDLSSAMEIASAGMATYGNSFEQILGLVTSGTEIMVGRSAQVARGLNTIAARISTNGELLKKYGIQVADANGNLMSTYDVLSALKPKWDKMSDAERVALGDALAG